MTDRSKPFKFRICGLSELPLVATRFSPTHVISISDPGTREVPAFARDTKVLRLAFWDVHALCETSSGWLDAEQRAAYPTTDHAKAILEFGQTLPKKARVLIHCWAGFSRSAAAAFLLLCQAMQDEERRALRLVRKRRPGASPNRMIVAYGDRLLKAEGRMLAALDQPEEFRLRDLPVRLGERIRARAL